MPEPLPSATDVAQQLAAALDAQGQEYALGGAIALGYWGEPRGTVDVDLTLFLPADKPSQCIGCLQDIGCDVKPAAVLQSLQEHGFCRVSYQGVRVDVFLPIVPFYEAARQRRKMVQLSGQSIAIWDAESLVVFKMMFFRRKDVADVEQILRSQIVNLDCDWIRGHLIDIYGQRDPRVAQWEELVSERARE
jgi:hypothetical protein